LASLDIAQGEQQAAKKLRCAGRAGVKHAGAEPDLIEEAGSDIDPGAIEGADAFWRHARQT
jgi:hypothetical protein